MLSFSRKDLKYIYNNLYISKLYSLYKILAVGET